MSEGPNLQLTNQQIGTLETFKEITQINDDFLCVQILQQNSWDIDRSLNQFVLEQSNSPTSGTSRNSQQADQDATAENEETNTGNSWNNSHQTERVREQHSSREVQNATTIFSLLTAPLRWLFQAAPVSLNPAQDTQRFIDDFETRYGSVHPNFFPSSYQAAVVRAKETNKLLLVYLHSPIHEDTAKFCQNVLCNNNFINFVNENAIMWIGRVWDPEAFVLSSQLRTSAFPFMALLICPTNTSAQLVDRIQGEMGADALLDRLRGATQGVSSLLNHNRVQSTRRAEANRLREQQDREYHESMLADQREAVRRAEEQRREAEEEETRKIEEEIKQNEENEKRLREENKLQNLKDFFVRNPEPPAPVGGKSEDVATVRFQLPKGTKLSRRFYKHDKVQIVYDFLTVHFADSQWLGIVKNFSVTTHFPKQELDDMNLTLEDVGLYPRGMLYVQDLDS